MGRLVVEAEEVLGIAGRQDLFAVAERPDVMARVCYLLETLRGCAGGTNPKAQPALFALASAVMSPLVCTHALPHPPSRNLFRHLP
jgi:hypothetical protein